jgi:hypothetical protein
MVRASKLKPKGIYAPRIISDHIMLQEDFERLHKFLLETEGLSEVSTTCDSWSRTNGRSWCISCRQRCLLGADKDCAEPRAQQPSKIPWAPAWSLASAPPQKC